MSSKNQTTVLLVSSSKFWTRTTRSVLATLPHIVLLDTAHGGLTAYKYVVEKQPHVLIIDDSLPDEEAQMLVNNIRAAALPTYCIRVVPTAQQKRLALANVADAVIARSSSSQQLITAVLSARDQQPRS